MKKDQLTARLSHEDLSNLGFLADIWGLKNSSEVLRQALKLAVAVIHKQEVQPDKLKILQKSSFIGSVRSEKNLSMTYKSHIRDKVKKKHASHNS